MPADQPYMPLLAYVLFYFQGADSPPALPVLKEEIDQLWQQGESELLATGMRNEDLPRVQLPIAAWVDEAILTSNWSQKEQWQAVSLQRRHFRTVNAGQLFFDQLRQLCDDDQRLKEPYGLCLSLGFKGAFFQPADAPHLKEARLQAGVVSTAPKDFLAPDLLFPAAYGTLGPSRPERFWRRQWERHVWFLLPPIFLLLLWISCQWLLNRQLLQGLGISSLG